MTNSIKTTINADRKEGQTKHASLNDNSSDGFNVGGIVINFGTLGAVI